MNTAVETEVKAKVAKAPKAKVAKAPKEKKERKPGIGALCKQLITEGLTNAEILEAVKADFPEAKTTAGCVAFYRNKLKAPVAKAA